MSAHTPTCRFCGTNKLELFKVNDDLWAQIGLNSKQFACLECFKDKLGRELTPDDLSPTPWWEAERPVYYQGIRDGLLQFCDPKHENNGEYNEGWRIGRIFFGET